MVVANYNKLNFKEKHPTGSPYVLDILCSDLSFGGRLDNDRFDHYTELYHQKLV
jgi:hypothetical protein